MDEENFRETASAVLADRHQHGGVSETLAAMTVILLFDIRQQLTSAGVMVSEMHRADMAEHNGGPNTNIVHEVELERLRDWLSMRVPAEVGSEVNMRNVVTRTMEYAERLDRDVANLTNTAEPSPSLRNLQSQIDDLACYIVDNVPGEPSRSEGAVETAIRIMREDRHTINLAHRRMGVLISFARVAFPGDAASITEETVIRYVLAKVKLMIGEKLAMERSASEFGAWMEKVFPRSAEAEIDAQSVRYLRGQIEQLDATIKELFPDRPPHPRPCQDAAEIIRQLRHVQLKSLGAAGDGGYRTAFDELEKKFEAHKQEHSIERSRLRDAIKARNNEIDNLHGYIARMSRDKGGATEALQLSHEKKIASLTDQHALAMSIAAAERESEEKHLREVIHERNQSITRLQLNANNMEEAINRLEREARSTRDYNVATEETILKRMEALRQATTTARDPGNAGASGYIRGMANGLTLALAVMQGSGEPDYLNPTDDEEREAGVHRRLGDLSIQATIARNDFRETAQAQEPSEYARGLADGMTKAYAFILGAEATLLDAAVYQGKHSALDELAMARKEIVGLRERVGELEGLCGQWATTNAATQDALDRLDRSIYRGMDFPAGVRITSRLPAIERALWAWISASWPGPEQNGNLAVAARAYFNLAERNPDPAQNELPLDNGAVAEQSDTIVHRHTGMNVGSQLKDAMSFNDGQKEAGPGAVELAEAERVERIPSEFAKNTGC